MTYLEYYNYAVQYPFLIIIIFVLIINILVYSHSPCSRSSAMELTFFNEINADRF